MKIGPLRTLALCATCAALAGAGSAALAAGDDAGPDDGPVTTVAPPGEAGQTKMMIRKCVVEGPVPARTGGADVAGEAAGKPDEKCTVTAGSPPPGAVELPPPGGCVKVEAGGADKAAFGAMSRAKLGALTREKLAAVAREKAAAAAAAR
jgi:hypothetical protein